MKLNEFKEDVTILKGDQSSDRSFGIEGKNMHLAIQAFYQYSDPIGSIVREITSNAYDAHIEADQNKPVIIRVNQAEDQLHILDFGVGMSPERVKDIYTKFFSSTKRETNEQIGAFGLGSKSPMSYAEMFQVYTKYGDTVYEHIVHKADGIPNLVTVEETPYSEDDNWPWEINENGTEIIVPYHTKDESKVINSIRIQLAYFNNIVVDGPDFETYNNETILKGNHFIYRKSDASELNRMHICVGKVYYPLAGSIFDFFTKHYSSPDKMAMHILDAYDTVHPGADIQVDRKTNKALDTFLNSLSWSRYYSTYNTATYLKRAERVPIGLYFNIGELPILWHRENIEYTDQAVKTITQRFFEMFFEIQKRQKERIGPVTSLLQGLEMTGVRDDDLIMGEEAMKMTDTEVQIDELEEVIGEYGHLSSRYSTPLWFIDNLYKRHEDSKWSVSNSDVGKILVGNLKGNLYYIDENERRKDYLKGYMEKDMRNFGLLQLNRDPTDWFSGWGDILPKHQQIIKQYANEFFDAVEAKISNVNSIEIPDSFLASAASTQAKQATTIPILWRELKGHGGDVQYRRGDLKPVSINKLNYGDVQFVPSLLVYGFQADRKLLNTVASINTESLLRKKFNGSSDTRRETPRAILGIISKDTATFINEICPAIYVKDFLYHRRFLATPTTAFLLHRYMEKNPWLKKQIKHFEHNWVKLLHGKLITQEEYEKVTSVKNIVGSFHEKHTKPYLKHALKNKFYHQDELDLIKWAHGMYRKYWIPLSSHTSLYRETNTEYLEQIRSLIPESINPTLYLKHYVNNIRTESE